jgi:hypothetical protein
MKFVNRSLVCLLLVVGVAAAQDRPRVYLQAVSHGNTWNARRDQSIEMAKDFEKNCPGAALTITPEKADYTVVLSHIEVGLFARENQIEVANKNGDVLSAADKSGIKGGVKDACRLILADWQKDTDPRPVTPAAAPEAAPPDTSAEARQHFAEAADKQLRHESAGFAEVVNTTLVVHSIYADKDHYDELIGDQKFTAELRRRGFTQFVYTNDGHKTFTWDMEPRAEVKTPYSF